MTYEDLQRAAAKSSEAHPDAPNLVLKRFLSVDRRGRIQYDGLLALVQSLGPADPRVRKVLYFLWAWRDSRIRSYVTQVIADEKGLWRPGEVTKLSNAAHFEKWLNDRSAAKARSNFEFFLVESGIFDKASRKVHLDLEDGWLVDAMTIVAEDETDPAKKARMIADPVGYLMSHGLNGLANVTAEKASAAFTGQLEQVELLDDTLLPAAIPSPSHEWRAREIKSLKRRGPAAGMDLVALERAVVAHQRLERIAAEGLIAVGMKPCQTDSIDMFCVDGALGAVFEMKSCHVGNVHAQIRKGISQLLEYGYLYRDTLPRAHVRVLVLETKPVGDKAWLIDYMGSLGLVLAWASADGKALLSRHNVPDALKSVIRQEG